MDANTSHSSRNADNKPKSVASVACSLCYRKKRKCDRELPSCGRCVKSKNRCVYNNSPHETSGYMPLGGLLNGLASTGGLDALITTQTLQDLATPPLQIVRNYARTVDKWLPIIKLSRLTDRLEVVHRDSPISLRANTTALLLSMQLAMQSSANEGSTETPKSQNGLYLQCKMNFSLLQAFKSSALETRQCGLLLAVYELGAGLISDAYVTLSTTAGIVRIKQLPLYHLDGPYKESDNEAKRIWWGVFLLDRLIAQSHWETTHCPLIMEQPAWSAALPNEDSPNKVMVRMQDIGAQECEYFCRELQAAYLACQVIEYNRHYKDEEKRGLDWNELMARLTRLLNTLFAQAPGSWRPSCGAIAMVIIATLDLHLSSLGTNDSRTSSQLPSSVEASASTVRINTEIVTNSLADNDKAIHDLLPIAGVIANYRTSQVICRRAEASQSLTMEDRHALTTMTKALKRAKLRWGLADTYLHEIAGLLDVW